MKNKTQIMIATLAGSCFVVITQLATISVNDISSNLHNTLRLFSFATPVLAVASFNVPGYSCSEGGSRMRLVEALLFFCACISALLGYFLLFFNFGGLTGSTFLVGVIVAGIILYLHGMENRMK